MVDRTLRETELQDLSGIRKAEVFSGEPDRSQPAGVQAAIARTATRSIALFFARPVRLFRPSKVNGWQTLKNLAGQQGATLTHRYLFTLVKSQGVWIIPKHFVPPMIVNAILGTILWTTYGETNKRLDAALPNLVVLNVMISGALAGACQAFVAAPAENARILLEHGFRGHSWSCAWKEIFQAGNSGSNHTSRRDVRQLRGWFQEVSHMAGRGWNGWGYGLAKDTFGFSAFFLIFELSRRAGSKARDLYVSSLSTFSSTQYNGFIRKQIPAVVNGSILVTGGVVAGLTYEFISRPWDVARRTIYLDRLDKSHAHDSFYTILRRKIVADGLGSLFKPITSPSESAGPKRRWNTALRTAGRVGPWGIGFLVWEAYSSGINK